MKVKVYRSAADGKFVTKEFAEKNPTTTICETMKYSDVPEGVEIHPLSKEEEQEVK